MSDFKVLNDEDHIKLRPSMYISDVTLSEKYGYYFDGKQTNYTKINVVQGLCKIINEIIDNSVDEFIRTNGKFANKIEVCMRKTSNSFEVKVSDNGSGIPVKLIEGTNEYQPTLCWGKPRAGSNFNSNRTTAGMNGVGSFLTYVFSETFKGETHDGKNGLVFEKRDNVRVFPSKKQGTIVTFMPDMSNFDVVMDDENYQNHEDAIKQRLINLSLCYPKINFSFNNENVSLKSIDIFAKAISDTYVSITNDKFSIVVASTAEVQEFRFHNYTNGLYNVSGGTVVDYVCSQLCAAIIPLIKRKHKIEVTSNQIKNNLFIGVFAIGFVDLKFDSQTKVRITNSVKEVAEYFDYDFSALAKKVMANDEIIDPIVKAILFKKAQAENLALARDQKKLKNEKVLNHIPANHNKREECNIFITEGQSSIGFFISARDSNKLGLYSLQGKIDNVNKLTPNEIVNVKVLKELISVVGLQLNKPPINLNYGKIIFATDADVDGSSIAMLLINFFALWGEEIFDRIYRVLPPLYSASKKGVKTKYYYNQEDYDNAQKELKGYTCLYIKGLGQMSESAYADMINNPRLVKITWDEYAKKYLEMLFGKDEQKRKDWLLTGDFK